MSQKDFKLSTNKIINFKFARNGKFKRISMEKKLDINCKLF